MTNKSKAFYLLTCFSVYLFLSVNHSCLQAGTPAAAMQIVLSSVPSMPIIAFMWSS